MGQSGQRPDREMMSNPPPKLTRILQNFSLLEDRAERIELLISMADQFRRVPPEIASPPFPEENRVPHCESEVFVFPVRQDGETFKFHFAVENPQGISAMATAVILDQVLSGRPLQEILKIDPGFIYEVCGRELSTGKGLGLTGIVTTVQSLAKRQSGGHTSAAGSRELS